MSWFCAVRPLSALIFFDQRSTKSVLIAGAIIELTGLLLLQFTQGFATLLGFGLIIAIGGGLVTASLHGALSRLSAQHDQDKLFDYFYFLTNVAALLGPILWWPWIGFHTLYLALGFIPALLYLSRANVFQRQPEQTSLSFFSSLKKLAENRAILKFFLFTSTFDACYTLIFSSVPVLAKSLGEPLSGNVSLAINAGTIIAFSYVIGKILSKTRLHQQFSTQVFIGYFYLFEGMGKNSHIRTCAVPKTPRF